MIMNQWKDDRSPNIRDRLRSRTPPKLNPENNGHPPHTSEVKTTFVKQHTLGAYQSTVTIQKLFPMLIELLQASQVALEGFSELDKGRFRLRQSKLDKLPRCTRGLWTRFSPPQRISTP